MDRNQQEHIKDGNRYTELEYPCYRKIGDSNLFKLLDATNFLNVMIAKDGGARIIGLGIMQPQAVPGFMQSTSPAAAEEFDAFAKPIIDKIIDVL